MVVVRVRAVTGKPRGAEREHTRRLGSTTGGVIGQGRTLYP